MSWQTDITTIIRHLLNDLNSSSFTYTDDRIHKTIIVYVL